MKLEINQEDIQAAVTPYNFSLVDIINIVPRLTVGEFDGCAINLVCNKVLVITDGIVLVYTKLEDFLNGFEPLSLVKSETIKYTSKIPSMEIIINPTKAIEVKEEDFAPIRELMFGARPNPEE